MSETGRTDAGPAPSQLRLLTGDKQRPDWDIDDKTRQIGRQGVAAIRETLRRARPPMPVKKAS